MTQQHFAASQTSGGFALVCTCGCVCAVHPPEQQEQGLRSTSGLSPISSREVKISAQAHTRVCSWQCRMTLERGAGQERESTIGYDRNGGTCSKAEYNNLNWSLFKT